MQEQTTLEKLNEKISQMLQKHHELQNENEMMRNEIVTLKSEKEISNQEIERLTDENVMKDLEIEEIVTKIESILG